MAAPISAAPSGDAPMTVPQLLALHPFPDAWANAKRIERLWVFDVAGTPEALWPHIADTSRMNRVLGTAEMRFEERDNKSCCNDKTGSESHNFTQEPGIWVSNRWLTFVWFYEL